MIAGILFLGGRYDREPAFFRRPVRLLMLGVTVIAAGAVVLAFSVSGASAPAAASAPPVADTGQQGSSDTGQQRSTETDRQHSTETASGTAPPVPPPGRTPAPSSSGSPADAEAYTALRYGRMPAHEGAPTASREDSDIAGAETGRRSLPRGAMSAELPAALLETHRFGPVESVAPGAPLPDGEVEMLFIHAHPDDESLDFGRLMAHAARSGKRIATVLFTDGEAGHDRYPDRPVYGEYVDAPLSGSALAQLRVKEAENALSILGSRYYIRLGRNNHPYASITEELSLEEVLDRWGGLERNVEQLIRIIRELQPELVVSPPGPSEVSEHFEHEAVAYIVQQTLLRLEEEGEHSVRGYLVAVDPAHRELYDSLVAVPGGAAAGPPDGVEAAAGSSASELQQLQIAALRQHVTQLDAAVVGIATHSRQGRETYAPLAWRYERSFSEWLQNGVVAGE